MEREFSLAKRLRVIRLERSLTLRQAEEVTGVDKGTISKIERGERHPYGVTLARLAKGYGVPIADLVEEPAPLAEAPGAGQTGLDPWAMLAERDAERRAAALEAATFEERERYAANLVAAVEHCALALTQEAAKPPAAADERAAHAVRIRKLWELRDAYTVLLNEVVPIAFPEPQMARELIPA